MASCVSILGQIFQCLLMLYIAHIPQTPDECPLVWVRGFAYSYANRVNKRTFGWLTSSPYLTICSRYSSRKQTASLLPLFCQFIAFSITFAPAVLHFLAHLECRLCNLDEADDLVDKFEYMELAQHALYRLKRTVAPFGLCIAPSN